MPDKLPDSSLSQLRHWVAVGEVPDARYQMPDAREVPLIWELGVASSPGFQPGATLIPTRAGALLSATRGFEAPRPDTITQFNGSIALGSNWKIDSWRSELSRQRDS